MSELNLMPVPTGVGINPLLRVGGALGIAGSSIAVLIFVVGCFGYQAVFTGLPLVPLVMALPGLVLSLFGGFVAGRGKADPDTRVLALGTELEPLELDASGVEFACPGRDEHVLACACRGPYVLDREKGERHEPAVNGERAHLSLSRARDDAQGRALLVVRIHAPRRR